MNHRSLKMSGNSLTTKEKYLSRRPSTSTSKNISAMLQKDSKDDLNQSQNFISSSQNQLKYYLKSTLNSKNFAQNQYKFLQKSKLDNSQSRFSEKSKISEESNSKSNFVSFDFVKTTQIQPKQKYFSLLQDKNKKLQKEKFDKTSSTLVLSMENNSSVDGKQSISLNSINFSKLKLKLNQIENKIQKIGSSKEKDNKNKSQNISYTVTKTSIAPMVKNLLYQGLKTQISSFFDKKSLPVQVPDSQNKGYINFHSSKVQEKVNHSQVVSRSQNFLSNNFVLNQSDTKNNDTPQKSELNFTYFVSPLIKNFHNTKLLRYKHFVNILKVLKTAGSMNIPKDLQRKKKQLLQKEFYKNKMTLILDLDETLIHCNPHPNTPSDLKLNIKVPNGSTLQININIRPHVQKFLELMAKEFEIMIFTASHACYANVILDHLDPQKKLIQHRLYRESCSQTENGFFVKDLRIINRDLKNMVIVDNAVQSFLYQIDNGIPILDFYDNKNDRELLDLMDYLHQVKNYSDVCNINQLTFKLSQYNSFQDPTVLLQELFQTNPL